MLKNWRFLCFPLTDQCRSSYQVGYDNSLRITYANGMDTHYQTEPHILTGAANPTVARRNMSLPGEVGQNLVEWRFRKEQARGKVIVFGRKLRVSLDPRLLPSVIITKNKQCNRGNIRQQKVILSRSFKMSVPPKISQ